MAEKEQWQGEKEQWQIEMQNILSKQEEKEQWQKKAEEQWQDEKEQPTLEAEEKRKIALRFKEIGADIKLIVEATGLSPEEIDSL